MSYSLAEHVEDMKKHVHFLEGLTQEYPDVKRHALADGELAYFTAKGTPTDVCIVRNKEGECFFYAYFLYREGRVFVSRDNGWVHSASQWAVLREFKKANSDGYASLVKAVVDCG